MQRAALVCIATVAFTVTTLVAQRTATEYRWDLPPGVPSPRLPVDTPITPERVELGRYLFYDTRLSGNGKQLFAAAFPSAAPADGHPAGVERLVTTENIALALAAFQRSIVSFRSPYDRLRFHDDETALSPSARRGMRLFFSRRARCGGCHLGHTVSTDLGLNLDGGSKAVSSPLSDPSVFLFHNTGLYNLPGPVPYPADNTGKYAHTGDLEDVGRFRIPTLRNVAVTAPYMHDGSIAALGEVLDHYVAGGPDAQYAAERFDPAANAAGGRTAGLDRVPPEPDRRGAVARPAPERSLEYSVALPGASTATAVPDRRSRPSGAGRPTGRPRPEHAPHDATGVHFVRP